MAPVAGQNERGENERDKYVRYRGWESGVWAIQNTTSCGQVGRGTISRRIMEVNASMGSRLEIHGSCDAVGVPLPAASARFVAEKSPSQAAAARVRMSSRPGAARLGGCWDA